MKDADRKVIDDCLFQMRKLIRDIEGVLKDY